MIPERSTSWLTIELYDKDGKLETPSSVVYSIMDVASKEILVPETNLPSSSVIEVELSPQVNRIVNPKNKEETRRVTVIAYYGDNDSLTGEFDYIVKNLTGVQ
jgi:hypothetical protein